MSLGALLAAASLLSVLALLWQLRGVSPWVITPLVLSAGHFYAARSVLVLTGTDSPNPVDLFPSGVAAAFIEATLLVAVYYAIAGFVLVAYSSRSAVEWTGGRLSSRTIARLERAAALLTLAGLPVLGYLMVKFGGPTGMIHAARREGAFAGLHFLRQGFVVANILWLGLFVVGVWGDLGGAKGKLRSHHYLLLAFLTGGAVFLWGTRSVLAQDGAALMISWLLLRPKKARAHTVLTTYLVAGGLILVLLGGLYSLRLFRHEVTSGRVSATLQTESTIHNVSIATNQSFMDAVALAVRDWPETHEFRGVEDFTVGATAFIPRIIWPSKPATVNTGTWFRQVYQPRTKHGWPLGAVGEWYLAWGQGGVLLGGALTGVTLLGTAGLFRRLELGALAGCCLMAFAVTSFRTGFDTEVPSNLISIALPVYLILRWASRPAPFPYFGEALQAPDRIGVMP